QVPAATISSSAVTVTMPRLCASRSTRPAAECYPGRAANGRSKQGRCEVAGGVRSYTFCREIVYPGSSRLAPEMDESSSFAALLRQYRTSRCLTQQELAERSGLSTRAISDLERGARRYPYRETVARIALSLALDETECAALRATIRRPPAHGATVHDSWPSAAELPTPATSLIGREREITRVRQILTSARLGSLVGAGGIGKTRLALQVATECVSDFPDGVLFVSLAPLTDAALAVPTIAQTIGVREDAGRDEFENLVRYLQRKRMLVVVDTFERVVDAAQSLAQLLSRAPQLKILVTSRTVLKVSGEQQFRVPPLSLPRRDNGNAATDGMESEAVRLFVDRARAANP